MGRSSDDSDPELQGTPDRPRQGAFGDQPHRDVNRSSEAKTVAGPGRSKPVVVQPFTRTSGKAAARATSKTTSKATAAASDPDEFETVVADPEQRSRGKPSGPSLKARAVAYLSRREHSRQELARKLAPHAESPEALDAVLDELAAQGWQSDTRFAQSVVRRQSERHGTARIIQTLRQQGVDDTLTASLRDTLRSTELQRARDVWLKRFGGLAPADAQAYAKQVRFLSARGFGHDTIRQVLRADFDPDALGETGDTP